MSGLQFKHAIISFIKALSLSSIALLLLRNNSVCINMHIIESVICSLFVSNLRPTQEYSIYVETSPLPVKGFRYWPILATHGHWAVRFLFAWYTYCDMWKMSLKSLYVIFKDSWHSHLLTRVWQCDCHFLFLRLRSVAAGIRTPNISHARRPL